ncbi:MAG: aldo/keto reductase [Rhodospirillales bacterium]
MEYRNLGKSGVKVSPICLGTMTFGGRTDEAASGRIIAQARESGVNFIDTADVYMKGKSEQVVGRAIGNQRQWWVLATKLYEPMGEGPNQRGLSRGWIMQEIDASLKRLGTDYVDILYLHKEDRATPLEETVSAMGDVIRQGKARYFGVSNYRGWRVAEIVRICDRLGIDRPVVSQPYYNAMNRTAEVEHIPACAHFGIGIVPYSPAARGVLSGKYSLDQPPPADSRVGAKDVRIMQTEWRKESIEMAQIIKAHAAKRGMTAVQFAVLWVMNNRHVTAPIVGPRTIEQCAEYLGALKHRFTAEDEALVDGLVAPGHPSTPGYNDPAYPLEGRQTWT